MKTLQEQIEEIQHEYAGIPDNHAKTCECSICEFPRRIMKILANREEEIVKDIIRRMDQVDKKESLRDFEDAFISLLSSLKADLTKNRGSE